MKCLQTLFVCTLAWCVSLGVASAAIQFVKPEKRVVSPQPQHLAVADVNGDGLIDVVSSSPRSREVNILLANPDGVLAPGQVITVGNALRQVVIAELNNDGKPDIAVIDERTDGVFIMLNEGDGTFAQPALKSIGRNPFGVAISDFDGVNGNDLAITDRAVNRVYILQNDGRLNPNFSAGADFEVGQSPEDIIAGDFNGDGAADLVTLNQGGARVKDVTMLLFSRVQAGFPVFERLANFGVGERPESPISGDFNEDGILDLAMVNRPFGIQADAQVLFLFGQGNGFLNLVNPLDVPCPFFTNGLPCRPHALGAADFDANGMLDLVVSMTDPRQEKLGDILNVYKGDGDGFYVPGPVFLTDPVPAAIGVADITGGGLADVVVASSRLSSIQVFVNNSSVSEDNRLPGQRCEDGNQCTTSYCVDGVCCRAQCDEATELCNIPGAEGDCLPADGNLPLGRPCVTGDQCQSDFCTNEVCCIVGTCPTDARCDIPGSEPGTCAIPLANGEPCVSPDHCRTGNCLDLYCCDSDCPNGRCDIPGKLGICTDPLPLGETCSLDDQCVTGICDIVGRVCCSTTCAATEECTSDGTSCGPPSMTVTPNITPGADGGPCTDEGDCDSGNCVDNVCCKVPACDGPLVCAIGSGECATPTPTSNVTPTSTPDLSCGVCPAECPCVNGLCLCAGRSGGGCSATDTGDSRQVFLALLLPAGLWVARKMKAIRANARR